MCVDAIGDHHGQRGQQRHHRGPEEALAGLQVGGQHDGQPVQRQLEGEDAQQRGAERHAGGAGIPGGQQELGQRGGEGDHKRR